MRKTSQVNPNFKRPWELDTENERIFANDWTTEDFLHYIHSKRKYEYIGHTFYIEIFPDDEEKYLVADVEVQSGERNFLCEIEKIYHKGNNTKYIERGSVDCLSPKYELWLTSNQLDSRPYSYDILEHALKNIPKEKMVINDASLARVYAEQIWSTSEATLNRP